MFKNPALLLFIFWISIAHTQNNYTVIEQLSNLNKQWADKDLDYPELDKKTALKNDRQLIQMHLSLVLRSLRNTDHELNASQIKKRKACLEVLEKYCEQGVFPKNSFHAQRTPYFIDEYGTACAVGHLIIQSGSAALANKIANENNYAYIEDLNYPELKEWATQHGFTIDELKWIQPAYTSCNSPCSNESKKDVSCYGGNDGCIGAVSADTVAPPYTFAWYKLNNGVWDLFSYDNEICDLFAGQYKCVFMGANGNSETHLFTISQPDSIPNDTTVTTCDSFLAPDSVTYFNSGLLSMMACDSLPYSIDLTVLSSSDTSWSVSACKNYTAPDGSVYTSSGIYHSILTNSVGCDSTVQIDVAILNDGLSIQQYSDTLLSTVEADAYQWLYCDSNYTVIPGENDSLFVPSVNGNYAVVTTQNNCTDTSACFNVNYLGTKQESSILLSNLFPNPNHGSFTIELTNNYDNCSISIVDIHGKEVYYYEKFTGSVLNINEPLSQGVYYLKIKRSAGIPQTTAFTVK